MRFAQLAIIFCSGAAASAPPAAPSPPPLAAAFSINFSETFSGYPAPPSTGAWFYDFNQRLWRVEHHAPNSNNFCSCALNTSDSCALIFTARGMFADFPDHPEACCRVCGEAEGCSILAPTWLSRNATAAGVTDDGCSKFCEPGAETTGDCLSYAPGLKNPPCKYSESFNFGPGQTVTHNLTFSRASYKEGPQDPARFAVRPSCLKNCPQQFPATCG